MAGGLLMPVQALTFDSPRLILLLWSDHQDCPSVIPDVLFMGLQAFGYMFAFVVLSTHTAHCPESNVTYALCMCGFVAGMKSCKPR